MYSSLECKHLTPIERLFQYILAVVLYHCFYEVVNMNTHVYEEMEGEYWN